MKNMKNAFTHKHSLSERDARNRDTHLYLKPIVLLHIKLAHLHTGLEVNLSIKVIFLHGKHRDK